MRDARRNRSQAEPSSTRDIQLSLIKESDDLRLRDPPFENIDLLAADIESNGQTTPIFVRPLADNTFELISGYRRVAALNRLGFQSVNARVFDLDPQQAYRLAISENQQRGDLTEFERARICLRLQEQGLTYEQIAAQMGWTSDKSVQRYIRIANDSTPALREALNARRISLRGAIVFLRLGKDLADEKQRELLGSDAVAEMSSDELEQHLLRATKMPRKAGPKNSDPIRALKSGGFILRSIRFTTDSLDTIRSSIDLLKTALQKARRIEKEIEQRTNTEITDPPQHVAS